LVWGREVVALMPIQKNTEHIQALHAKMAEEWLGVHVVGTSR